MVLCRQRLGLARCKLGERYYKSGSKRDKRRPCGENKPVRPEQQSGENRGKGCRSHKAAAQRVKQLPALNIRKKCAFAEYPAGVLPVAAYPAVTAPKIGDRRTGEGVGKLNAAHISAAQIRSLECIVRKNPALGNVHLGAQQQRFGVDYALAGKTAAVEKIHAHLAAEHAVWLKSAASGENARKIGRNGRGQRCAHARMYDAVPGGDKSSLAVEHRRVHRVQHCADKLANRAGRGHGVAVEGENVARRAQKLSVAAARVQLAFIAAHELCKLQQRAALALKAGVFSAPFVECSLAREKIKSAAVFSVQRIDSALSRCNDCLVLRHGFGF